MTLLNRIALIAVVTLFVGGCDGATKTFGRSYNECVIKNASKSVAQGGLAEAACRRHFETPSASGGYADGSASLHRGGKDSAFTFTVANADASKIITGVSITATFGEGPNQRDMAWTFGTFIEPDQQVQLTGTIGEEPPPENFTTQIRVTREISTK
jgi:hypothetical protein